MSKFVLTAQLQLKAPANTQQVVSQMRRQLSGINVNVGVKGAPQAQKQIAKVNQQVSKLNKSGARLGKTFGLAINRFAAFTVASRGVSLFTNGLANATKEAIAFERELVKISQVTGKTIQELSGLNNTITQLSVNLGTSSKDLLATTRILAQAGIQARDLDVALAALAKTTLAPTFEDITKTAEGAVAILAQFGQGVGALERQLGAINAVAGQFAVESGDLISVVRRTGGVFKAAGGDLNELLGLFTSVRATTRESAESIATGLRTIFTRIQRPKTIEFLKQFGVELVDLNGKFVGPFEAVKQLSAALSGLGEGDIRFVQIAEELGGFRQIGKVIPLLQQFETAERARQAALEGGDSLTRDAATAQQALAIQITKVKEEFLALVRSISQTGSFQTLVKTTLDLASALISVADALKPIIPLLTAFAGIKLAQGVMGFGRGLGASLKAGPRGFNSGGLVPGTGNGDTVPAMLTPGEFVIRKSSVKKMGVGALAEMNGNKYNKGGSVAINPNSRDIKVLVNSRQNPGNTIPPAIPIGDAKGARSPLKTFGSNVLAQAGITNLAFNSPLTVSGFNDDGVFDKSKKKVIDSGKKMVSELKAGVNGKTPNLDRQEDNIITALNTSLGRAFEEYVGDIAQFDSPGNQNFDIPRGLGEKLRPYTAEPFTGKTLGEIKIRDTEANLSSVIKKAANEGMFNQFIRSRMTKDSKKGGKGRKRNFFGGPIQKFALGGLAQKNRMGFAILDPDRKAQDMDAKVTRAQIRNAVKGTESQRKALDKELSWPNKNFKVARQGLNAKTSQRFYDTLSREAAQGVSVAATGLSSDLGLGNITVPETSKQLIADSIRKSGSMMGKVFEDVVNLMDGRGNFSPSPPGAPIDFKGGLQGALKDNYDRLPSTFVDAKTSYGEASAGEAQKKIINEIAQTYQQTPTYANSKKGDKKSETDKQAAARVQREQKGQARLAKLRAKSGYNMGGAAPSDTVPALLTPGEFVINKSAASKIGKANLDRMNKKGVQGFAAGGVVQRFTNGGSPKPQGLGYPGVMTGSKELTKQLQVEDNIRRVLNQQLQQQIPALQNLTKNAGFIPNSLKVWDNATKTSAVSIQSTGATTSSALKNTGEEVKKADSRLVQGIKAIGERVRNSGDRLSQGFTKINTFVGKQAGNLATAFNSVTTTLNTKGESTFRNFFSGIDRQTPTLQAAFKKVSEGVSGSIKKITAPLDKSSGEIQKVATKLSSTAATVRTGATGPANFNFKGVNDTDGALKRFKAALSQANVEVSKQGPLTAKFTRSLQSSTTVSEALKKTFAGTDIAVKRLEKTTAKVSIAKEKEAAATNKSAAADNRKAAAGAGGMGGGAAMGAFFAIQGIASMIPQVEGATEGLGAMQNAIGPVIMQLGVLGMLATSFSGNLGKFVGALGISIGAVHALNTMIDAYTGVHEKAKKAVEEGNIGQAGRAAVSSTAQKDVNKFAMGLAATGTAIGAIFGPGGAVVGAIIGGLAGLGAKVLGMMLPESVITGFRDKFLTAFGADSTALIAARATAAAALKRAELDAAKNAERAAAALKQVESGSMSLADAFESGELTRDVKAYNLAVKKAQNVERIAAGEAAAASSTGSQAVATGGGALAGAAAGALAGAAIGTIVPVIGTAVGAAVGGVIGAVGGGFFGSGADDQKKAGADKATQQTKQAMEALNASVKKLIPQFTQLGRNLFVQGKNFSDFTKQISDSLGIDFSKLDPDIQIQLAKNFKANAIAVAENTKAFAESNLGLRPLETLGAGLNTSLNRITSVIEGKFNSLGSAVDIVGAALSGAEVDAATFDTALAQINSSFRQFGVSDVAISKLNKNFNALRTASGGFDEALNSVRDRMLSDEGLVDDSGKRVSVKDALIDEISNLDGLDEEGKRIVKNIFGNIDFSNDEINRLREGDLSPILDKLDEAGKKAFEGVQKASAELVSAQNTLVSITKKRAEAELKMIAAQKKAIGLQEEAAGILAELGGEKLSPTERAGFAQARLSADLRGGVGSDGSTAGIMSRIGLIQSQAGAATGRLASVAGGAEGDTFQFAQDQQSLANANRELDSLAEYARKRVKIYQDELAIVEKKNSLEKSSLEKLISGDVSGFVEGQGAAAAQIALRSGNQSLANMFSSSSLGTAFSNLEGQGLSDSEKRAAASVALGPGFASDRNVGVLTGTTSEEKSIKDNIAEQASILQAIAPAIKQLGSADFNIATAGLQKANDEFVNAQQRAAKASAEFAANQEKVNQKAAEQEQRAKEAGEAADRAISSAEEQRKKQEAADRGGDKDIGINNATIEVENQVAGFARGGMVYASRGMFVPRGTDTVPAMLTPGEFVVNRASVQRGNNLQVLQAMNSNGAAPAAAPAQAMSKGGPVYMDRGGNVPSTDMTAMFKTFESSARVFSDAVNRLTGFKLNVKLDPTNVNVNLNGGTFLNQMKNELKTELLEIVSDRIRNSSFDNTGDFNIDPYTQSIV